MNAIEIKSSFDWQWPALTEKQAMHNHQCYNLHSADKLYVGCAWASIIDFINYNFFTSNYDYIENENVRNYLFNKINIPNIENYETHTVCQHIFWERMLGFWKHVGIKHIHLSHLTRKNFYNGLYLHPWHLIATNCEIPKRNKNLIIKKDKKYLCSFIGANNDVYKKRGYEVRFKLNDVFNNKDKIYFKLNDEWFYNDIVYEKQIKNRNIDDKINYIKQETDNYNEVLSDSVFSLCPEGTGPNTLRLWESMSIGVIPVLFESDWFRPDVGMGWEEFSITISKDDISKTYDILKKFPVDRIEDMRIKCINAYNYVRTKTCF